MNKKEKRNHIRISLLNEYCLLKLNDVSQSVKLDNISEIGAFLENLILKHGTKGKLIFELPGELGYLTIPFTVKRTQWAQVKKYNYKVGSGVEFNVSNQTNLNILKSYVTYLKNKQIISVSKRIVEEFFKPK